MKTELKKRTELENDPPTRGSHAAVQSRVFRLTAAEAVLSLVGGGIAGMLWWSGRRDVELPCTGDGLGCGLAEGSRWSHISIGNGHSVPVALLGLLGFVTLFSLAFLKLGMSRAQAVFHRVVLGISAIGSAYSLFLQYVAHFQIHAFCIWCFSSAAAMLLVFALALREDQLRRQRSAGAVKIGAIQTESPVTRPPAMRVNAAGLLILWMASLAGSAFVVRSFVAARDWSNVDTVKLASMWPAVLAHAASAPRGASAAPYTMVEFGDFQCPPCGEARPVLEQLLRQYPRQVNLVFVHRPLPRRHPWALPAAEASQIASAHGKFWPMYDVLYSHQDHLDPSFYNQYAVGVGLSEPQFEAAFQSHQDRGPVEATARFADSLRIFATPTLLLRDNRSGAVGAYIGPASIKRLARNPPWTSAASSLPSKQP